MLTVFSVAHEVHHGGHIQNGRNSQICVLEGGQADITNADPLPMMAGVLQDLCHCAVWCVSHICVTCLRVIRL